MFSFAQAIARLYLPFDSLFLIFDKSPSSLMLKSERKPTVFFPFFGNPIGCVDSG
jgi:hypothetical protein